MPVLTQVIEDLLGAMPHRPDQNVSALRGLLAALFAGVPGGQNSTGVGGLQGLATRFRAVGLSPIMESWLGDGPDLPVTPNQLWRVLGDERVQAMAAHAGLTPEALLVQLSQFLPGVVSRLVPHGEVPPPQHDPTLVGRNAAEKV